MRRFFVSRTPLTRTADVGLSSENLYTGVREFVEYFGEVDSL